MASFFRNKLQAQIGTSEVLVLTTTTATRSTVIGLSLTNLTGSIVLSSIRLALVDGTQVSLTGLTNVSAAYTITGVSDANAALIPVGFTVSGTNVQPGTRVASKTQVATNNNTITLSLPSSGGAITSATFTSSSYYIKDVIIPPNQSLRVINGGEKLILAGDMQMYIQANVADSVDLAMSYVDIV